MGSAQAEGEPARCLPVCSVTVRSHRTDRRAYSFDQQLRRSKLLYHGCVRTVFDRDFMKAGVKTLDEKVTGNGPTYSAYNLVSNRSRFIP